MKYRKSPSCCRDASCVEIAYDGDHVHVRNTDTPGDVLTFTREEWADFLLGVRAGEFDMGAQ